MLATGQYQTQRYQNKEDWWLVKYLKLKYEKEGLSPKEFKELIKKQWEPIYNTRYNKEDIGDYNYYINKHFDMVYNRGKNVSLDKTLSKIIIYQNELDYINSLPAPKWFREFILLFLGHCKTTKNYIYDYAPTKDYMGYLSLHTKNRDAITMTIYDKLKTLGLWEEITVITKTSSKYFEEEEDSDIKFRFSLPVKQGGDIAYQFDRQIDLIKNLDIIHNRYRCDICGREFEINNRTQRTVCDACYKNNRKKDRHVK